MKGPDASNWGGGVTIRNGYRWFWQPDHPMANPRGYVAEHRAVMTELLGRPLRSDEHVHHKNHDRSDNRPENLELLAISEHISHHQQEIKAQYGWSRQFDACVVCGSTEQKHFGLGRCRRCYGRLKAREYAARRRELVASK